MTSKIVTLVAAAALAATGSLARAAGPEQAQAARVAPQADAQAAAGNMAGRRAVRDPQTGEFVNAPFAPAPQVNARSSRAAPGMSRGKPEEMNALMLQFHARSGAEPMQGSAAPRAMRLGPGHMSSNVVRRAPDGTLISQCVTGESAAEHALHAPTINVPALRRAHEEQ